MAGARNCAPGTIRSQIGPFAIVPAKYYASARPVDTYIVAHDRGADVDVPTTFAAIKPRIAIMNNGVSSGGALVTYQAQRHVAGLEDVWHAHASADAGASNYPGQYIANLDENTSHRLEPVRKDKFDPYSR